MPADKLVQMAKLGVVLDDLDGRKRPRRHGDPVLDELQQNFGCNVCTLMSMMSEKLMPSACEVDVTGVLTMYALQLARARPARWSTGTTTTAAIDDKCVLFHCGNWAKAFLPDIKIANAPILGRSLGVENTYGALEGRTPAGPLTFGAFHDGRPRASVAAMSARRIHRRRAEDVRHPRGRQVPDLQKLLRGVCRRGSNTTWS